MGNSILLKYLKFSPIIKWSKNLFFFGQGFKIDRKNYGGRLHNDENMMHQIYMVDEKMMMKLVPWMIYCKRGCKVDEIWNQCFHNESNLLNG